VVANDVVAVAIYGPYSRVDQAVSELSAKGAPSRPFLVAMIVLWTPAMIAFGGGVWQSAQGRRVLRVTGALLVAFGVTSLVWLPFPMTAREDIMRGATATNDVGHIAMSAVTVFLIVAQIASGAVALGKGFRVYSLATAVTVLVFGALTSAQATNLANGKPTPWMGLYERTSIGAWLVWMAALAVPLIRRSSLPSAGA
jgi:hypothetical protein